MDWHETKQEPKLQKYGDKANRTEENKDETQKQKQMPVQRAEHLATDSCHNEPETAKANNQLPRLP